MTLVTRRNSYCNYYYCIILYNYYIITMYKIQLINYLNLLTNNNNIQLNYDYLKTQRKLLNPELIIEYAEKYCKNYHINITK